MAKVAKRKKAQRAASSKQPFWIAIGVAVVLLVGAAAFVMTREEEPPEGFVPEVTGAPRVAVSEEVIDYGDVKLNETIETVFNVRNVGDQTLNILGEPPVQVVEGC